MKKTIIAIAILTLTLGYQNAQAQSPKNNNKPKTEKKEVAGRKDPYNIYRKGASYIYQSNEYSCVRIVRKKITKKNLEI
jgi:hypothetical protein